MAQQFFDQDASGTNNVEAEQGFCTEGDIVGIDDIDNIVDALFHASPGAILTVLRRRCGRVWHGSVQLALPKRGNVDV